MLFDIEDIERTISYYWLVRMCWNVGMYLWTWCAPYANMSSIKYGHFVIFYTEVKLLCQARRLRAGHTRTHARTHARTHTRAHTRAHMRTHAHTHAHALTHTHTHTQTHTHTPICSVYYSFCSVYYNLGWRLAEVILFIIRSIGRQQLGYIRLHPVQCRNSFS